MKISNLFLSFVLAAVILSGGCSSTGFWGTSSNKVEKQSNRISEVQDKIIKNSDDKVFLAKDFSFGTAYALSKVTNQEPAIIVAKELNERVENLIGLPVLAQQKGLIIFVNGLISNNIAAKKELAQKDRDISSLQDEESFLIKTKDKEIHKALDLSAQVALQADSSKQELDKYRGWFGLSAIWMGLKQLFTYGFWTFLTLGIAFLVLRILSTVNPICGAIFGIFDLMCSWVVNSIKIIAPKAMGIAETVGKDVFDASHNTLTAIVDSVATTQLVGSASGKQVEIQNLLNTLELSTTPEQKVLIKQIKQDLGWIKPSTTSSVAPVTPTVTTTTSN
jgi:hypothetical protein